MQWDLAAKYLAGECSPEERLRFERWVAEDPERGSQVASLRPYFSAPAPPPSVDLEAAWARMSERIARDDLGVRAGSETASPWRRGARVRQWGLAAAAILVVAATASVAIVRNHAGFETIDIVTGPTEKREVALADGSSIILAPLSRLQMNDERSAMLDGEAHFVVIHDSDRPFTVETGNATIRDLGTTFVVRAGSADRPTVVAVEEGVVSLAASTPGSAGSALILRKGESGTLARGAEPVRGDGAAWSQATAWTRGEIVFDMTPMREVVIEINRWFGITAILSDPSLETRTLSARLSGESADEVADAVDRSLGVTHTRRGDTIVFRP